MLRSQIGQFLCESFASDDYHSSYAEPINNPAYTATCFSICQQHVPGNWRTWKACFLPDADTMQRWRRHWSDFRARREYRASSWWTQKAFPSRAPWTTPPPHSMPTSCTTSSWRPGAPCVKLTPRMTSPSFEFAPRKMKLWLHQIKTISWLWFRIQLNKPLSWLPASFLNLIAPKNNNVNHVNLTGRWKSP